MFFYVYCRTPELYLEQSKGLSSIQLANLRRELETIANSLCGEVVVFELVQHAQVGTNIFFMMW